VTVPEWKTTREEAASNAIVPCTPSMPINYLVAPTQSSQSSQTNTQLTEPSTSVFE
jgi:hypothetical protein